MALSLLDTYFSNVISYGMFVAFRNQEEILVNCLKFTVYNPLSKYLDINIWVNFLLRHYMKLLFWKCCNGTTIYMTNKSMFYSNFLSNICTRYFSVIYVLTISYIIAYVSFFYTLISRKGFSETNTYHYGKDILKLA